jgi:hypothetical protein
MTPYMIATVLGTILGLKRDCPQCKKAQVVPPGMKHKMIQCKYCGADIPPKKPAK